MDENVVITQFISDIIHTHIQGGQARGKTKEEGRRHRVTQHQHRVPREGLDTHIGSDYCDKYEIMFSFRSFILSILSKFHAASGLAQGNMQTELAFILIFCDEIDYPR